MNKKILFLIALGFLIIPTIGLAQLQPYAPGAPQVTSFSGLIQNIVWAIWIIFTVIVVLSFIYAGIMFLTASGDSKKLETAKQAFVWGVVGVIVGVIAFTIITIVSRVVLFGG